MNILQEFDTITAIATPLGTGGVGIIRISGDKAYGIIEKIFSNNNLIAGKIAHGWICDNEIKLDEVIVLPFKAPNSFTGEDVIEIHCHGGINVINNVLELVLKSGARMAEKGEFTKRAFLNKKMDLSQAEAIADIIHSKTKNFAKISAKNLSGVLGQKIKEIRKLIFELLSKIIAGIDFPEDVKEPEYDYLIKNIENIIEQINKILNSAKASNVMRQGLKIAIAGKPNVGKSSLFNTLLDMERAIVTDIAGTTRDILKENLDWDIPITLIDTAGIRKTDNKVEKIGVEYSKQTLDEADLTIFVYDCNAGMQDEDYEILNYIKDKPHIIAANKSDLNINELIDNAIEISTVNKNGIDKLKLKMKEYSKNYTNDDMEFVTNTRQQQCLQNCLKSLNEALISARNNELQDLISIDLKSALLFLDEITGEVITDEILNNIFENFCIGK